MQRGCVCSMLAERLAIPKFQIIYLIPTWANQEQWTQQFDFTTAVIANRCVCVCGGGVQSYVARLDESNPNTQAFEALDDNQILTYDFIFH